MKYSFKNDYSEIAHKKILEKLISCADEQNIGYGLDKHTDVAKKSIMQKMNCIDCDIYFLAGGTQTNLVAISGFLKNYEAAIAVDSGHINVHETGAIEGSGHKILVCKGENGKLRAEDIKEIINLHTDMHMVKPKLVYISNSTEIGTVYTKKELEAIKEVCLNNDLYLFLDGARLASALCSSDCDLTLHDLTVYCDAFYIGATKSGGFLGEALVLVNDDLKKDFPYHIKNKGALLSKGFVNAINFEVLFEDDLFFEIGRHENEMAKILSDGIADLDFDFLCETTTNQIFPIFSNKLIDELSKNFIFDKWCDFDEDSSVVRLVTSFATTKEKCLEFLECLSKNLE